jgi:hypothetical protein
VRLGLGNCNPFYPYFFSCNGCIFRASFRTRSSRNLVGFVSFLGSHFNDEQEDPVVELEDAAATKMNEAVRSI